MIEKSQFFEDLWCLISKRRLWCSLTLLSMLN